VQICRRFYAGNLVGAHLRVRPKKVQICRRFRAAGGGGPYGGGTIDGTSKSLISHSSLLTPNSSLLTPHSPIAPLSPGIGSDTEIEAEIEIEIDL